MSDSLRQSYDLCRQAAWKSRSNFRLSFLMLPRNQRDAICSLYTFLRRTDDLADNDKPVAARQADLTSWRDALDRALRGTYDDPLFPALHDTVKNFGIPHHLLHAVIAGVERDLEMRPFATFPELESYCEKVASAVGACCLHIWQCWRLEVAEPARQCGIAFQLTNILRDLKEDATAGRVFLPLEDLDRFHYSVEQLTRHEVNASLRELVQFQIRRAEEYFRGAEVLANWLSGSGAASWRTMFDIYKDLLAKIKSQNGALFGPRISISRWKKLSIAARHFPAAYFSRNRRRNLEA